MEENHTRCDRCGEKRNNYWMAGHLKFCRKCRRLMIRLLELWLSGKLNNHLKDIGLWSLCCKTSEADYYSFGDAGSSKQISGKSANLIVIDDIGGDKE